MSKKPTPWVYGKSPNPSSWHETSNILKDINKPKRKPSGLLDRLSAIEELLRKK